MDNHKPNYLLDTWELLLSLINFDNGTKYELGDVTFGRMKSLEGDIKDTEIEVTFNTPPLNKSPKLYKYDRIHLDIIFSRVLLDTAKYGLASALKDEEGKYDPTKVVSFLLDTYHFNAREIDFQFEVRESKSVLGFYLIALPNNVAYRGSVFIPLEHTLAERVFITDMGFSFNND